jgi:hypothetical protein
MMRNITSTIFLALLAISPAFAQQNNKWDYDPENPSKVEEKGYYGVALKKISATHPSGDRGMILEAGDPCPFLGFSGKMAWFKLEDKKFQAPKDKFYYKPKNSDLKNRYELFIIKSKRFLSDADRHKMLLFLREKNIITSIRDAEKTWSDDKILESVTRLKETKFTQE